MTSEQWQRVKAVVAEALAAEPSARDELVARACGADETLRREVRSLLASIDLAADRFEGPLIDTPGAGAALRALIDGESADAGADVMVGRRIGPYRIVREIGRGGMGAVFLASAPTSSAQVSRIKVIKRGMDTDSSLRAVSHERQILASLEHPNIARLLDGGTSRTACRTSSWSTSTVCPIDVLRRHALSIDERLRLFLQVCAAVSYAHQHLVVHRDIKPSNILVTADGVPKLLDFGVAKVLHEDADEATLTVTGDAVADPGVRGSPEQIEGRHATTVSGRVRARRRALRAADRSPAVQSNAWQRSRLGPRDRRRSRGQAERRADECAPRFPSVAPHGGRHQRRARDDDTAPSSPAPGRPRHDRAQGAESGSGTQVRRRAGAVRRHPPPSRATADCRARRHIRLPGDEVRAPAHGGGRCRGAGRGDARGGDGRDERSGAHRAAGARARGATIQGREAARELVPVRLPRRDRDVAGIDGGSGDGGQDPHSSIFDSLTGEAGTDHELLLELSTAYFGSQTCRGDPPRRGLATRTPR